MWARLWDGGRRLIGRARRTGKAGVAPCRRPVVDFDRAARGAGRRPAPRLGRRARSRRGAGGRARPPLIQDLARELSAHVEPIGSAIARRLPLAETRLDGPGRPHGATAWPRASRTPTSVPSWRGSPTGCRPTRRARRRRRSRSSSTWRSATTASPSSSAATAPSARSCGRCGRRSATSACATAGSTARCSRSRRGRSRAYADSVCEHLTADVAGGAAPAAARPGRAGRAARAPSRASRASAVAEAALAELGYPVDACHVAVALPPCVDSDRLDDLARRLKLACGAPMLAAPDADGMTIWIAFGRAAAAAGLERARVLVDLEAADRRSATCGAGSDGFRRTRQQAADALRIAQLERGDRDHPLPRRRAARRPVRRRGAGPGARARGARPARRRRRRRDRACARRCACISRPARARWRPRSSCSSTRRRSSTG